VTFYLSLLYYKGVPQGWVLLKGSPLKNGGGFTQQVYILSFGVLYPREKGPPLLKTVSQPEIFSKTRLFAE